MLELGMISRVGLARVLVPVVLLAALSGACSTAARGELVATSDFDGRAGTPPAALADAITDQFESSSSTSGASLSAIAAPTAPPESPTAAPTEPDTAPTTPPSTATTAPTTPPSTATTAPSTPTPTLAPATPTPSPTTAPPTPTPLPTESDPSPAASTNEPVTTPATAESPTLEAQMVALVNELRRGAGIGELEVDRALTLVARERSNQLVSSFAHDLAYVVAVMPSGWSKLGENIAFSDLGMRDAQANLEASASHYANMVLPEYTRMGIGIVVTEGEHYDRVWVTQLFAAD